MYRFLALSISLNAIVRADSDSFSDDDEEDSNNDNDCTSTTTETITGIIYADNYFKFWFNGNLIAEDPVSFIPHQGVEVQFEAPVCDEYTFAIQANDFSADVTGLEYDDNCVGDGGLKAMFSDGTVTNGEWSCKTVMYGPLDPEQCIPDYNPSYHFTPPQCKGNADESLKGRTCRVEYFGYSSSWIDQGFDINDAEGWEDATEFTDETVGWGVQPSDCEEYICPEDVDWGKYGDTASFIWRPDLNFDNRIICRYTYFRKQSTQEEAMFSAKNKELHDFTSDQNISHQTNYNLLVELDAKALIGLALLLLGGCCILYTFVLAKSKCQNTCI